MRKIVHILSIVLLSVCAAGVGLCLGDMNGLRDVVGIEAKNLQEGVDYDIEHVTVDKVDIKDFHKKIYEVSFKNHNKKVKTIRTKDDVNPGDEIDVYTLDSLYYGSSVDWMMKEACERYEIEQTVVKGVGVFMFVLFVVIWFSFDKDEEDKIDERIVSSVSINGDDEGIICAGKDRLL